MTINTPSTDGKGVPARATHEPVDRVAVVTGGGSGLGECIAGLLAQRGVRVIVGDIDISSANRVAANLRGFGLEVVAVKADVRNDDDCARLMRSATDRWGRLDWLVCNAGVQVDRTIVDTSEEEWDFVIGVNLKGAFLCSKHAVPVMEKQGGGSILMISSVSGQVGNAQQASYNASKHGMIGLARAMAVDHATQGIRVNVLCPGSMDTALSRAIPEEKLAPYRDRNLLKRFADPIEVAHCAVFLLSDEASFVTGSVMTADGGYTTI